MPSDRTLILRRLEQAVEPAQASRKAKAQFGRAVNGTCRMLYCESCAAVFPETEAGAEGVGGYPTCPTCGMECAA